MKFIAIVLALCLAAVCSAQDPPNRPTVITHHEEGCFPRDLILIISCGCFMTLLVAPTNKSAREECRIVTGSPIRTSQSACDPFLIENNTNYDFAGIIRSIGDVKNRCFAGEAVLFRHTLGDLIANFPILRKRTQLFVLANQLCKIFGEATPSEVPALGRIIETKPAIRAALLKKFNNL